MGKRSDFERRKNDLYKTWDGRAVKALLPHLRPGSLFSEPCAGDGALIRQLVAAGLNVQDAMDIDPGGPRIRQGDALTADLGQPEQFITNPPWTREILHPLIERLSGIAPTWLLFDADWMHTKQSIPLISRLRCIVSVGRLKWIEGSKHDGKDNCCWYLFDASSSQDAVFRGRLSE